MSRAIHDPDPDRPLAEIVEALQTGRWRASDYAERLLTRIAEREGELRAWVDFDAARVRRLAASYDRPADDEAEAPLYGIPVGVKDLLGTAELPTQMGSAVYAGHQTGQDAAAVQRLQTAGAYVMGKTVTAEFAFMHPGPTRNPHHAAHTPGGSSSGSAAAVAAGCVPLALGTQTNGSVVRPAAFCGVVGFKPTGGTVPGGGCFVYSATLDQIGLFTRTVADAALGASVLMDDQDLREALPTIGRPPRFAWLRQLPWNELEPDAAAHFDTTLERLQAAGANLVELDLPPGLHEGRAVHRVIMYYEAARQHARTLADPEAPLSATLRAALTEGAAIPEADYRAALMTRAVMMEQARDLWPEYDAILSPPAPGVAPAGLHTTGDPSFATLWTLLGVPAISIPSGWSEEGLPYGLQLATGLGEDRRLLEVAHWCEAALETGNRRD